MVVVVVVLPEGMVRPSLSLGRAVKVFSVHSSFSFRFQICFTGTCGSCGCVESLVLGVSLQAGNGNYLSEDISHWDCKTIGMDVSRNCGNPGTRRLGGHMRPTCSGQ